MMRKNDAWHHHLDGRVTFVRSTWIVMSVGKKEKMHKTLILFIGCKGCGDPFGPFYLKFHRGNSGPVPPICPVGFALIRTFSSSDSFVGKRGGRRSPSSTRSIPCHLLRNQGSKPMVNIFSACITGRAPRPDAQHAFQETAR